MNARNMIRNQAKIISERAMIMQRGTILSTRNATNVRCLSTLAAARVCRTSIGPHRTIFGYPISNNIASTHIAQATPTLSSEVSLPIRNNLRMSFSTASKDVQTPSKASLRNLVKPFLLKCHPDLHSTPSIKQANLKAVQTLNSYLDTVEDLCRQPGTITQPRPPVAIEFCIEIKTAIGAKHRKKSHTTMTRRRVELVIPHFVSTSAIQHHAFNELGKLLHMAGLEVPPNPYAAVQSSSTTQSSSSVVYDGIFYTDSPYSAVNSRRAAREAWMRQGNWERVKESLKETNRRAHYRQTVQEVMKRKPGLKRQWIASILSRIQIQDEIPAVDQLIAFRRWSLLLNDYWDDLVMEWCDLWSPVWEQMTIVWTLGKDAQAQPEASNLPSSRKRSSYFVGCVRPDGRLTLYVPLDFRNDELAREVRRLLQDYQMYLDDNKLEFDFNKGRPYSNNNADSANANANASDGDVEAEKM
jgi:Domain of unknown function (DUF4460)